MQETTVRIQPVDRDGPSIVIFKEANSGKVAIGRGEFLRCADKKVSRVHAELELDSDGLLHLTPLHVNPCFYFPSGDEQSREEVRKGDQRVLKEGDHFSLLATSYVYKVLIENVDPGNGGSKLLDEDNAQPPPLPLNSHFNGSREDLQQSADVEQMDVEQHQERNRNADADDDEKIQTGSETRKRTLPACVLQMAAAEQTSEKPKISSAKAKKKVVAKSKVSRSPMDKPSTSRRKSLSSNSDDDESVDWVVRTPVSTKTMTLNNEKRDSKKKDVADDDDVKSTKTVKNSKRASCRFGDQCYRKNPAHLDEFCHPGDSDYSSDSQGNELQDSETTSANAADDDQNDLRPECEYGVNCYRKNTQHRSAYKHTTRPKTQRKAAKEAKKRTLKANGQSGDSDGSYDESFIDDDSDEYKPSKDEVEYSDDDEEDLKRLKKEAVTFVKNKKFHKMH